MADADPQRVVLTPAEVVARDAAALDQINFVLSRDDWDVSMLEDIEMIVFRSGRVTVDGADRWPAFCADVAAALERGDA